MTRANDHQFWKGQNRYNLPQPFRYISQARGGNTRRLLPPCRGLKEVAMPDLSEAQLRELLRHDPRHTEARVRLAAIWIARQKYHDAERLLAEGITIGVAHPALLLQHGECLLDLRQPGAAIARFREVLRLCPQHADALASLGGALLQVGDLTSAVDALGQAAGLLPQDAVVHELWGEALAGTEQAAAAADAFERAWQLGRQTRAIAFYCGNAACDQGRFAHAVAFFRAGSELPGGEPIPWVNWGKAYFELGDVSAATAALRYAAQDQEIAAWRNLALMIPGDPAAGPTDIAHVRKAYAQQIAVPNLPDRTRRATRSKHAGPLRIGYVSSFFAHPNYMKPVYAVLAAHDPRRVDVELFHDGPSSEEFQSCVAQSAVSIVHQVASLTNSQLIDCILGRQLDLVVDLNGYSAMERLPIYTVRLAPLVVGWFNHYATASLAGIDVLLGDANTCYADEQESFSERIQELPVSYLAFRVTHAVPDVVPAPCLERGYLTFGSLCTQYKITPVVLRTWAELLRAAPTSRLLLANRTLESPDVAHYVRDTLQSEGIAAARITLRGGGAHYDYLTNYNDIDIALDAWPYNGGTTTTEALWQGVPVLTFRGDRWASRTSASLLADGPFAEFLRGTRDDMVQFAVTLATRSTTPHYLQDLRTSARARLLESSACDTERLARSLEEVYWRLAAPGDERTGSQKG
ncbi:MAG: hypothetical protein A2W31_12195 [Planctomycetes bacterium RBG_16_64_10]|nr:MAG: hypothetical protein A2W31_12195 [Planctomycetes bacterium RBG_16_64_10]